MHKHLLQMVLAGLNPATIIDIAHRAIKLWNFQINQEKLYFMSLEQSLRTKHAQLEPVSYTHLDVYKRQIVNT